MKTFILLVTWIVAGQPTSSYQSNFKSAEACDAARIAVLAEGRRIKTEFDQRILASGKAARDEETAQQLLMVSPAPMVTAVCAASE
jgi:hypothetical protein